MTDKKISRRATRRAPRRPEPPLYPRVFETYRPPGSMAIADMQDTRPSVVNSISIRRYEVTIRRIEEPVEVLRERLLRLWRESERNMHTWDPMHNAARDLGIENPCEFLPYDEQGRDYKRKS